MTVEVHVSDEAVDVRLTGMDVVWSLRRSLHLPISEIVSARVTPRDEALGILGWRLGGTYFPGRIAAGRFTVRGHKGERAFCCLFSDPQVLVIETRRPSPRYVILQHPEHHDLAWFIGERID